MARSSRSRKLPPEGAPAGERLPIYLRGYAHQIPRKTPDNKKAELPPGQWTLIFDTETTVDVAQRLRVGAYQLLKDGRLRQRGLFFNPGSLSEPDVECLRSAATLEGVRLHHLDEFIEEIIFDTIYKTGGTIVGFNLPFDLSRLSRSWDSARGKKMKGGFSFKLSNYKSRPRLRIKHLSRRLSFFDFAAPGKQRTSTSGRRQGEKTEIERGYFLDLATFGAALTGQGHSLSSLASLLGTLHQKVEYDEFDGPVTPELVSYALNDVQVTRECWEKLVERFSVHAATGRPAHKIYSEASLGKAYLDAMGIRHWREVQPDFDPGLVGAIMSTYYGGRAEVHRRREVVRTLYCDFASMYPTVCTLMRLWRFVIARGVDHEDATEETRSFLAAIELGALQKPSRWPELTTIVELEPEEDILPVRARYGSAPVATIGVNYLTSTAPLWFTLADCVASKLLTGKPPRVRRAVRFSPMVPQDGLKAAALAGDTENPVDPLTDDFYRRVIDLRRLTQKRMKAETDADQRKRLDAYQLALKILANATSYGIFIQVDVEELDKPEIVALFEGEHVRDVQTDRREAPGPFFHPLLATLITGAARLLLAVTERKLIDAGLNWAFCDTDSMAFAKPIDLDASEFERRVRNICGWFEPLDPFENKGAVLEIEKQNFSADPEHASELYPLYCYAVSAKRYALFNHQPGYEPIIRKASGHGLGHLLPPYKDPDRKRHATGVPAWQEDFWREIVKAGIAGRPDEVQLRWHEKINAPAASQYTAAAPARIKPFKEFNKRQPTSKRIQPFNFTLWFHARRPEELVAEGFDIAWDKRMTAPKPVAPFDKDPGKAATQAFDRRSGAPVGPEWLASELCWNVGDGAIRRRGLTFAR